MTDSSPEAVAAMSRGNDGGHLLGNFPKYYEHFDNSPRARTLLLSDYFHENGIIVESYLDVGSNSGELTSAMHELTKSRRTVGVEIDAILVQRARARFALIDFTCANALDFLATCSRVALISVFSTTMWVHLNHGDQGLESLLRLASARCTYLIIEPQPYDAYQRAARRVRKIGLTLPHRLEKLGIKTPERFIVDYLTRECNMVLMSKFGPTQWSREIFLFGPPPPQG